LRSALLCAVLASSLLGVGAAHAAQPDALAEANRLLARSEFAAAEAELRAALAAGRDTGPIRHALGRALAGQGRPAEAIASYGRALELDPAQPGLHRDLGNALFETGDYARARDELSAAVAEDPDDGLAELQLGLATLAEGDARAAARHFDRAAEVDPELAVLALYNAGVAYERAGDRGRAAARAQQVLQLDPHPEAARSAQLLLERVEAWHPWRLAGSFGLLYDDNVSQSEVDVSSGRADGAGVIELGGSYRLLEDSLHRLETSYDFYQTAYFHESDFDLQSHDFGVSGGRVVGPVEAVLDYRYSVATLGGDFFLGFHQLSPSLEFAPRPGWYSVVGPRVVVKSFDDSLRDAVQSGFAADTYFFPQVLWEPVPTGSFGTLGLGFQSEDAEGAEFDYTGVGLRAGIHLPFPVAGTEHALDFTYRFRWRDYANVTPSIGVTRLDAVHGTRLRLSRAVGAIARLRLDYEFTRSDSNLPSMDYDQNAVSLSLGFSL
jgi:tetratricopeptide (TPR) repeat protein